MRHMSLLQMHGGQYAQKDALPNVHPTMVSRAVSRVDSPKRGRHTTN